MSMNEFGEIVRDINSEQLEQKQKYDKVLYTPVDEKKDDVKYDKVLYTPVDEKKDDKKYDKVLYTPVDEKKDDEKYDKVLYTPVDEKKDEVKYDKVLYTPVDETKDDVKIEKKEEIDPEIIYYGCIEKIARDYIKTGKMNISIVPKEVLKKITSKYKDNGEFTTNIEEVQEFISNINKRIEELKTNENKKTL